MKTLLAATAAAALVLTAAPASASPSPEGWDCDQAHLCLYSDTGYRDKRLDTTEPGCVDLADYELKDHVWSYFNNNMLWVAGLYTANSDAAVDYLEPGEMSDDSSAYTTVDYMCFGMPG